MASKLDIPNPHHKNGKNFQIPPYRQLGAGPVNCSVEVLHAMFHQPITPTNKYMFEMFDDIQLMTRYLYQTRNPLTFVAQVTGNGGNETLITNLADPGDTIVVASAGLWGDKVANMGERYGLNVIKLTVAPGEVYSFEELEQAISENQAVALFVTHGESSGGTLQPLEGLGKICHKYNCLLAVDAVVSIGVAPIFVDRWEIDAITGSSQKGLGAPAGLCLMTFSNRAHQRILNKKTPPPYIFDTLTLAEVWNCFGYTRTYHYTYSSTLIAAVRQALIEVCEEGLENVWERHRKASQLFCDKMDRLGIGLFVKKPENRFCGVNAIILPEGVQWPKLLKYTMDLHTIEFSFGIGPTKDKDLRNLRIGFLADNARPEVVEHFVKVLESGIQHCRNDETHSEQHVNI